MGLMRFLKRLTNPADSGAPSEPAATPDGPPPVLTEDGLLRSELWLDADDADARIDRRLGRGEITAEQADQLRRFAERGYLILQPEIDESTYAAIDADVERMWRDRPDDVAYAFHSLLTRFSDSRPEHRRPSCRIADLHSASAAARELFLHRQIFAMIETIFGEPAVATQSLYFEWGSQQALHRDPVHVVMNPPSHLLAAWIALEDIGPDCGPLIYIPGSHRLPYYQFEPGQYRFDHSRFGDDETRAAEAWDQRQCAAAGLELETLTCRRGDVLIWHHSLLHGGSLPTDPNLTRKSFVIHYSTLNNMRVTHNSYRRPLADGDDEIVHLTSDRLFTAEGGRGFDSPLRAGSPPTAEAAD